MSESFETITIACEWDLGELRAVRLMLNDKIIQWRQVGGVVANSQADLLSKAVGHWKIEQDKRNVSP